MEMTYEGLASSSWAKEFDMLSQRILTCFDIPTKNFSESLYPNLKAIFHFGLELNQTNLIFGDFKVKLFSTDFEGIKLGFKILHRQVSIFRVPNARQFHLARILYDLAELGKQVDRFIENDKLVPEDLRCETLNTESWLMKMLEIPDEEEIKEIVQNMSFTITVE